MSDLQPCDTESAATVSRFAPSRTALWLNYRIARYGVTEEAREHGLAMLTWIMTYNPDQLVRETAYGMLKAIQRRMA